MHEEEAPLSLVESIIYYKYDLKHMCQSQQQGSSPF
jgi:hypothetical protein